jgi:hypothetical protein
MFFPSRRRGGLPLFVSGVAERSPTDAREHNAITDLRLKAQSQN